MSHEIEPTRGRPRRPSDAYIIDEDEHVRLYMCSFLVAKIVLYYLCACGQARKRAQPRHVPLLITSAVIYA